LINIKITNEHISLLNFCRKPGTVDGNNCQKLRLRYSHQNCPSFTEDTTRNILVSFIPGHSKCTRYE